MSSRGREQELAALRELASLYGVESEYRDVDNRRRRAAADTVLALLSLLGAEVRCLGDASRALAGARTAERSRRLPAYVVAWNGVLPIETRSLSLKGALSGSMLPKTHVQLELENGETWTAEPAAGSLGLAGSPKKLPFGYHRVRLEVKGVSEQCALISAPRLAFGGDRARGRGWGLTAPTYALRDDDGWGVGGLRELGRLINFVSQRGGGSVATLPLLSCFLSEPFEPAPYRPVSRCFWNELFADLEALPEWQAVPEWQASPEWRAARGWGGSAAPSSLSAGVDCLRLKDYVDYRRAFAVKKDLARVMARRFFENPPPDRFERFVRFLAARPDSVAYARFRAHADRESAGWPEWTHEEKVRPDVPADMRADMSTGVLGLEEPVRLYLYWQWVTEEQLAAVAHSDARVALHLDFPIGVHPGGFDTWAYRDAFVRGASIGAPPDTFFSGGQNWLVPPLNPRGLPGAGFDYLVTALRRHMEIAGGLRIDHVMGLHRQYWVPAGAVATEGAYVRYPAELLYAVLALESRRASCLVVGEDLGTVPHAVRPAMKKHGLRRTYVLQLEADPLMQKEPTISGPAGGPSSQSRRGRQRRLPSPPALSTAMLNTHDLVPFAAFTAGGRAGEVDRLLAQGTPPILDKAAPAAVDLLKAALLFLARSKAETVQISLADLWLETEPQNVPGTDGEALNWRRICRCTLEELTEHAATQALLAAVDDARRAREA